MNTRGFTLLELLVVTILLGALTLTALPLIGPARGRAAVRHAVDEFRAVHSLTRATAIRYGRVARLHIDNAAGRFWVEVDTSLTNSGVMDTIGTVRDVSNNLVTVTSTQDFLCFDGRGLATPVWDCPPGSAIVIFSRDKFADTVSVSVAGKVLRS